MAMRSVVGKLKALKLRMPRFFPVPPKDMLEYQRSVIDVTKYDSLEELDKALPALLEKKFKADLEAYERYGKACNRVTYVTAGATVGATVGATYWFVKWLFDPVLEDD